MGESESVAIVGMACRLPGDANTPEDFWRNLISGKCSITEIPAGRFQVDTLYDRNPATPGKTCTRWGGFLAHHDRFDCQFFGISPREAASMDPQHRWLLETAWEGLEDAGFSPDSLAGTSTGVFFGICNRDYAELFRPLDDPARIDAYFGTGNASSFAAGRLSHVLGLHGPSLVVDTACSSSLVAVNLACRSLLAGECDLALAGAANALLTPTGFVYMSQVRAVAPDGVCKAFSAGANGYVRGEGCGVIVLARLRDALASGARVRAVIRGSAVNHDGRSSTLTAPNRHAQVHLLKTALAKAGVEPATIAYVEAHGAGTALGDPIEADALNTALCGARTLEEPLLLGTVKANIGHLEASAGMAGLIKVVLSLEHGELPPHLHVCELNSAMEQFAIRVPNTRRKWPAQPGLRRAGVSSFGFGGTNAHVVLEEAPQVSGETAGARPQTALPLVLPISARSAWSLEKLRQDYIELLGTEDCFAPAVCANAALRRAHHARRLAVCGDTAAELRSRLQALPGFAKKEFEKKEFEKQEEDPVAGRLVLVFGGQGGQWAGMGEQLRQQEPVYRRQWEQCREVLLQAGGSELRRDGNDAAGNQAAVWALQCSLTELWRSWGITADAVIGHSMGEVAAAWAAGALTLEESALVMRVRGQLLNRLSGRGGMLAVESGGERLQELLRESASELEIAARNGPQWTVLSGGTAALERMAEELQERGIGHHHLHTNGVAGHSRHMDEVCGELRERLRDLCPQKLRCPMLSTVDGEWLEGEQLGAEYWARNLRQRVEFERSARRMLREGYGWYLEVGPHPQLKAALESCAEAEQRRPVLLHSLRREQAERREMMEALTQLYSLGRSLRWRALYPHSYPVISLPLYPWNRQRCWIDAPERKAARAYVGGHPLLGEPLHSSIDPGTHYWQREVSLDSLPWAHDHKVEGDAILPAVAYVEAVSAAFEELEDECPEIERLDIVQALVLQSGSSYDLQTVLKQIEPGKHEFRISSRICAQAKAEWQMHASGYVHAGSVEPATEKMLSLAEIQGRLGDKVSGDRHYATLDARFIEYGSSFRLMRDLRCGPEESLATIAAPTDRQQTATGRPLGWMDGLLQGLHGLVQGIWMPVTFRNLRMPRTCVPVHIYARLLEEPGDHTARFSLQIFSPQGKILGKCDAIELRRLDPVSTFHVEWSEELPARYASAGGRFLILDDSLNGHGAPLQQELQAQGQENVLAYPDAAAIDNIAAGEWRAVAYIAPQAAGFLEDACSKALSIIQRAALVRAAEPLRLYLITSNVHPAVKSEKPDISSAMLWGLRRTASIEYPHLRVAAIDIDGAASLAMLAQELLAEHFDEEVAFYGGRRRVARLMRMRSMPGQNTFVPSQICRSDSTYLITGALGGLGLLSAEWLVSKGARHLALIARQPAAAEAEQRLQILRKQGVTVNVFMADVSSRNELAAAIGGIRSTMPPVRGVLHAAGVLDDGLIENLTAERFCKVLRVKAGGAWHLHELFADWPLDWFVLYSSAAALIGAPGQANHAAANAFLDALAQARHGLGLPALSINWGPWAVHGAAAGERIAFLEQRGWAPIMAVQAFQALEKFLLSGVPQAAMFQLNFEAWQGYYPDSAHSGFLASLNRLPHSTAVKTRSRTPQETQSLLVAQAADVLHCPPKTIDPSRPLREFGLDSLRALELRNRIQTALGIHLPATIMWRYPAISSLSQHVHELAGQTQKS